MQWLIDIVYDRVMANLPPYLLNVVEDLSPQLGGDLDGQSVYDLVNMVDGDFSGTLQAGTLTDGTLSTTGGAVTGASTITFDAPGEGLFCDGAYVQFWGAPDDVLIYAPDDVRIEAQYASGLAEMTLRSGTDIDLTAADDININAVGDEINIDAGDDVRIDAYDDVYITARQASTGSVIRMIAGGDIHLITRGDTTDYIKLTTSGNVPAIETLGMCNLKVNPQGGNVDFASCNTYTLGFYEGKHNSLASNPGINDTFINGDGDTVTIEDGLIVSIV